MAALFTPSSSRTSAAKRSAAPGPITTGSGFTKILSSQFALRLYPGVMGPGFSPGRH